LSVSIEDDKVHIILHDDGQGLNFDHIAQTAKAKGLLEKLPPEKITRQFLSGLIFSPGFSTSEKENVHGGRGIGLNLVKDRLQEVKGKVAIQTKEGQGTTFDILIPTKT